MPALRPVKTLEEVRALPPDQPVLIELPSNMESPEPEAPQREAAPAKPEADAAATLRQQLEAMQAANRTHEDDKRRLTTERDEARRLAVTADTERAGAERQLVTTGLAGAQSDVLGAKQAYKAAMEASDFAAAADAQEKLSRASAMVLQYEALGADAAIRAEAAPRAPAPQPERQAQPTDPMQMVEASPQLLPSEKNWIKTHPETWTDRRLNIRLEDGYNRAAEKGLARGTDAYFQFLDQHMGFAGGTANHHEGSSVMSAAPVTRDNNSVSGQPLKPNQILLSEDQVKFCRDSGIDPFKYAVEARRMAADKKANPEKYFTNGR